MYQSEPMMEFIRYCVQTRNFAVLESFFSRRIARSRDSGRPEILAVHGALCCTWRRLCRVQCIVPLLHWFGVYYVIRTIREHLRTSMLAASAGGVLYLLNGYCVANLGSNILQNYLFIPFALHAAMSFTERRSPRTFAVMTIAFALLLACTFLPTTIVAVLTLFGILARPCRRDQQCAVLADAPERR